MTGTARHFASSLAIAVAIAGTALAGAIPATAQQASLEGSWSGSGTLQLPSGATENARCRASFRRNSANSFGMSATCATASGRIAQTAELSRVAGNRFAGSFDNAEYGVSGSIRVTVNGNSLSASLAGGGASAHLSLSR